MLDPSDMPEWTPMFDEMRRQSQRMAQIVEDLLTLTRLEAQEQLSGIVGMTAALQTLRREAALSRRHRITVEDIALVTLEARRELQRVLEPGQQCRALHTIRRRHPHPFRA